MRERRRRPTDASVASWRASSVADPLHVVARARGRVTHMRTCDLRDRGNSDDVCREPDLFWLAAIPIVVVRTDDDRPRSRGLR
jgi:hypothetical protein